MAARAVVRRKGRPTLPPSSASGTGSLRAALATIVWALSLAVALQYPAPQMEPVPPGPQAVAGVMVPGSVPSLAVVATSEYSPTA